MSRVLPSLGEILLDRASKPIIGVPKALKTWERGSGELGVFLVAGWFRET